MEMFSLSNFRFLLFSTKCGREEYLKLLLYKNVPIVCWLLVTTFDFMGHCHYTHCSQWSIRQYYC